MFLDIYVYKKNKLYKRMSLYSDLETIHDMIKNRCIWCRNGYNGREYILLEDCDYVKVSCR